LGGKATDVEAADDKYKARQSGLVVEKILAALRCQILTDQGQVRQAKIAQVPFATHNMDIQGSQGAGFDKADHLRRREDSFNGTNDEGVVDEGGCWENYGREERCHGGEDCNNEYDELGRFRPVLGAPNLNALSEVALNTRFKLIGPTSNMPTESLQLAEHLSCPIDADPSFGANNLVYVIRFSGGVRWVARIPGNGLEFGDLHVKRMNATYQAMRFINSQFGIPIPQVFTWETTSTNVGAPYALLSFAEWKPVSELWFDQAWITEEKRLKILDALAKMMSTFHSFEFERMGSLGFDGAHPTPSIVPIVSPYRGAETWFWSRIHMASSVWIRTLSFVEESSDT
jgi:hypothetical protein